MGCNKVPYESKKDALKDIKYQKAQGIRFSKRGNTARKDKKLFPYECIRCQKWHLTSQKQSNKVVKSHAR